MDKTTYESIELEKIPRNQEGQCLVDLYVHLPSSQRFIRFIAKGDEITPQKIEALKNHIVPNFYFNPKQTPTTVAPEIPDYFKMEVIGKDAELRIKEMCRDLLTNSLADPAQTLSAIEKLTDDIIAEVAPDSKKIKDYLLKYAKHVDIMNDSSAITTLAVLFALANGFDSRKSFKELTCAALVMDVGMLDLPIDEVNTYYSNRESLPLETLQKFHQHPHKSHMLAIEKLASLSETTMGLILNHHELFNGKGFPRGIRTESLFPMSRILALGVDVFERLKKADLLKTPKTIIEVLQELDIEAPEAHLRRHNKKLVDTSLAFLNEHKELADKLTNKAPPAAAATPQASTPPTKGA